MKAKGSISKVVKQTWRKHSNEQKLRPPEHHFPASKMSFSFDLLGLGEKCKTHYVTLFRVATSRLRPAIYTHLGNAQSGVSAFREPDSFFEKALPKKIIPESGNS